MVGKLIKHELYAIGRVLIFFAIALLGFAIILRILLAVEVYGSLTVLVMLFFFYAILAMSVCTFCLTISRFSKPLFTGEGYLTLSMPVSADQLIWSKLLSALIAELFSAVMCVIAVLILLIGFDRSVFVEIFEAIGPMLSQLGLYLRNDPLLVVELVLQFIVSLPTGLLVFYLILSIAQLSTRHRVGMAFLYGFAFYMGASILNVCIVAPALELIESIHVFLCIQIFISLAVDVACFLLVRYILRNKVNLIV